MDSRRLIAFGSGIGIEIGEEHLEVTIARVRPLGIDVVATTTIRNFAERPAAEWGAEYARFLKESGASHLTATVVVPRRETIARYVPLMGVVPRDMEAAVAFQVENLHPYGEDEAVYAWSPVTNGALVGIIHRTVLERYKTLFDEAGISVAALTFSAAVLYAARRLPAVSNQTVMPPDGFLALAEHADGTVEAYGESPARPLFSAEFDSNPARAAALAVAELRLAPGTAPVRLDEALPAPRNNPVTNDLARRAIPFAASISGSCRWLTQAANLLPSEQRSANSRALFVPSIVLAGILLLVAGGLFAHSALSDRSYLAGIEDEIHTLEPKARQAVSLDREIARANERTKLLDEFRQRSKADLDALNELTVILDPPTWANAIDITHDAVTLSGETEQAAPLLKLLDGSKYFQNSAFVGGLSRNSGNEQFQLRAVRKARP